MNRFLHNLTCAAAIAGSLFASSCSMMEDKVEECPSGLFVRYVYDYNIQRADMFKDHVGHVILYVYDENGRKVAERTVSNSASDKPLASYGYATHFSPAELAPGRYRLQAVAFQADPDHTDARRAKYRISPAQKADDLFINLEHSEQPDPATGRHAVSNAGMPLDTLWHTLKVMATDPMATHAVPDLDATRKPYSVYPLEEQYVTVAAGHATYATVSLIRDTKHLNITLRQMNNPADMQHARYEVTIDDNNALLAHDNAVTASDPVRYTPYAAWTTRFSNSGVEYESGTLSTPTKAAADEDPSTRRTAHFNLMYNRLMHDSDPAKCATLRIRNTTTGVDVATINLPYILSEGRSAYETLNYTPQEYLDREHEYHLDFILKGDTWEYCTVMIDILSWSRRFQRSNLE